MEDFKTIQTRERQNRIDAILNFDGYTAKQAKIIKNFYGTLRRKGL